MPGEHSLSFLDRKCVCGIHGSRALHPEDAVAPISHSGGGEPVGSPLVVDAAVPGGRVNTGSNVATPNLAHTSLCWTLTRRYVSASSSAAWLFVLIVALKHLVTMQEYFLPAVFLASIFIMPADFCMVSDHLEALFKEYLQYAQAQSNSQNRGRINRAMRVLQELIFPCRIHFLENLLNLIVAMEDSVLMLIGMNELCNDEWRWYFIGPAIFLLGIPRCVGRLSLFQDHSYLVDDRKNILQLMRQKFNGCFRRQGLNQEVPDGSSALATSGRVLLFLKPFCGLVAALSHGGESIFSCINSISLISDLEVAKYPLSITLGFLFAVKSGIVEADHVNEIPNFKFGSCQETLIIIYSLVVSFIYTIPMAACIDLAFDSPDSVQERMNFGISRFLIIIGCLFDTLVGNYFHGEYGGRAMQGVIAAGHSVRKLCREGLASSTLSEPLVSPAISPV